MQIGCVMRLLEERVEIRAPDGLVWDVLADFGGVADWAPYMRRYHLIGEQQAGIGMRRGMRHAWGFRFEEVVTQWHEGKGFAFDVLKAPFPMKDVKEVWVLAPENGHTAVETQVRYGTHLGVLGGIVDWLLVRFVVRREMRAGLRGLKEYAERAAIAAEAAPTSHRG
jgi:ligand-binding SRPBCC domain-containing protein